ncbi:MAG: TatD family hydrolase [Rikenellaceae bacterium]|nr:TatD family hydrolase [Rikenellaceae bacterium]MCL2693420.1 TatD family hydrolase [Rikenellaceae bacterium]
MNLIDTHSHVYDRAFDADRREVLERAVAAGVRRTMLPAIDSRSHSTLFALAREYPDACLPMIGLHPTSVNDNPHWQQELELVERYLQSPPQGVSRFYAVGEAGLDLYWSKDWAREQREAFEAQIDMAVRYGLPLAVHTRNAWPEMVEVLEGRRGQALRGVMHAFSGSYSDYKRIKDCGDWVFGIGGVVTYKNSELTELLGRVPLSDIVLETDCPYLPPIPHRGKRNESAYLPLICRKVAEIYGVSPDTVADTTTRTAERIFRL